jgi:biotin synthase-related radical SAM superfamily protein
MGKINIKGGTPRGWTSLCTTCSWAHIVTGFRESELVVICTEVNPNFAVPFKVQECTNYLDRNRPSYDAMAKLAIHVEPNSSLKPVGFRAKVALIEEKELEA